MDVDLIMPFLFTKKTETLMYKLEKIIAYTRDYTIFLSNLVDRRQNDQSDSTSENIQAYFLFFLLL